MKIFLATGASGGHLFPAIDVAGELVSRGHEVMLVGSLLKQARHLEERRLKFIPLATIGFNKGQRLSAFFLMIKAIGRSFRLLKENKPDVVIGFGGHGSFAVVTAAILSGIPSMIHEQNVKPGRANRWLSKFVKRIAVSFDGSAKYFSPEKICTTGCPTHLRVCAKEKSQIYAQWGLSPSQRTVLVFGGSQGAHRINVTFQEAVPMIKNKVDIQVIHISGDQDFLTVRQEYDRLAVVASVHTFLDHMEEAYQISDLVVSRAGAVTITELVLFRKKAVLIPYPFAGGHQYENAKELEKSGLGEIILDPQLTPQRLAQAIERQLSRPLEGAADGDGLAAKNDSSKKIADLVLSLK